MDLPRARRWALLAMAAIVVAACGDDDAPTAVESNTIPSVSTAAPASEPTVATTTPTTETTVTTTEPPVTEPPATDAPVTTTAPATNAGPLGIPAMCEPGGPCMSLALAEDGTLVRYDRSTATLTFAGPGAGPVTLLPSVAENVLYLEAVGPDDVAYFVGQQPETFDPVGYVVAVSTHPDNAGQTVFVGDDIDLSGDSDLFGTPDGLVSVGCCGGERRPATGTTPVIPWVDHLGAPIASARPDVWIEYPGDGSAVFNRRDGDAVRSWTSPDAVTRSMPVLGTLDDGGLMVDLGDPFDPTVPARLVRFGVDGSVVESPIEPATVVLVEPAGSVIAIQDGEYVRLAPFG